MSSKSSISPRTSPGSMDVMTHPLFQRAVERAANFKCLQAIKAGKLRVVTQEHANPAIATRFTPRMDVVDDPSSNSLIAVFELPGIKTSDVTLQIRGGSLIISGERRAPPAVEKALRALQRSLPRNPLTAADSLVSGEMESDTDSNSGTALPSTITLHELRFGQFYRAIPVPEGIKESDVSAALQDGMLTVTWPKYPNGTAMQNVTPPVSPMAARAAH
ncbi:HSP20-like chaperone [Ephemerocybe angulata]|uniref:HSP20-like chaperone n=1 Tax=Ephemerocybe angulata TaxID=980116 RepID=A0A8H6M0R5_9AGAR|nr:HSP20-like chaperone [Tulosesus angulatus]